VRDALRAVLWLAPVAAAVAGASSEIIAWLFGPRYAAAAPVLILLSAASFGRVVIRLTSTCFVAADRPGLRAIVAVPLVPLALAGDLWLIPRDGSLAAAAVSAGLAAVGAVAALALMRLVWQVAPPAASVGRAAVLTTGAWMLARYIPAAGWVVPLKLIVIAGLVALVLKLSREL
jgi:O-antigen/teichoic acid export membrane protein